ncbi:hypothetical protein C6Y53_06950 [Pukyongiella litopenaei]|uniref:Uncharacterized protein n=1 Tax=Pukyongiella litopenaei TaxID=2605946 RepID=A0A2S0MNM9_9RHOB|nr:hypothetical protein C6Y53_06950 [Pukyongiella litopenaei]
MQDLADAVKERIRDFGQGQPAWNGAQRIPDQQPRHQRDQRRCARRAPRGKVGKGRRDHHRGEHQSDNERDFRGHVGLRCDSPQNRTKPALCRIGFRKRR